MNIFLTGAAGYVASKLVPALLNEGHSLVCLDRAVPMTFQQLPGVQTITCDLLDTGAYKDHLKGIDLICHLAAAKGDWGISQTEYFRDNLEATKALLAAARAADVNKWLFYSTVSVLGSSSTALPENAPRRPENPYGASKAACEDLFDAYTQDDKNARVVTVRPSVVFGPGNPWNTNIFRLVDAIHRNRFVMIGAGDAVKTTSYLTNLVDATMFLIRKEDFGNRGLQEIYHYIDEPAINTAQLVDMIYADLGKSKPRFRVPLAIASPLALAADVTAAITGKDMPITSARIRKFCRPTCFSAERIRREGFQQSVTNEEALAATIKWYLDNQLNAA